MAVKFTPVRLVSKDGEEVIVTSAKDFTNLKFNGGYRTSDNQDDIEAGLKGGLDNGSPVDEDAETDASQVQPAVAGPAAGDKQVESDAKDKPRRSGTAVASAAGASSTPADTASA